MLFVENNDGEFDSVIMIKATCSGNAEGSPYCDGATDWFGNNQQSEQEFLSNFNRRYLEKCLVGNSIHDDSVQIQINCDFATVA